jgi:hypothetical protein
MTGRLPRRNYLPPKRLVAVTLNGVARRQTALLFGMTRVSLVASVVLHALVVAWCASTLADDDAVPVGVGRETNKAALHERIDELIEGAAVGPLAPVCSDADFVRRIFLDLTGVIPTAERAKEFALDKRADKRWRLIDELLASAEFSRHMTTTLDVMLMERKPDKVVKQPEWEAYLYRAVADSKPLDRLFREVIQADGNDAKQRAAARFVLDRDAEPNLITRDLGRLAFGMDLQCCQCHDHPLINDYYQDDYYGLYAFVQRTGLFTDAKTKLVSLTEKADGEASFKSVFTGAAQDKTVPRVPKGAVLFVEPQFAKGQEYQVAPAKDVRGVPKFSRRGALAEMLPGSEEFARNMANRLWALMFGRGIVHPLDFHYAGNPPANPRLLTLLANEFAASGFQLRPLLREAALTRVYQRTCEAPRPEMVNFADVAARVEQLEREKAVKQKAVEPLAAVLTKAKEAFKAVREEDAKVVAELPRLEKAVADARQALEKIAAERRKAAELAALIEKEAVAVSAAVAKLSAAARALSDDKVLAEAAEKVAARAAELGVVVDRVKKAGQQPGDGQADAAQGLANAEAALAAMMAKRPALERLRKVEQAQLAAQHELADANYAVAQCEAQIVAAKGLVDYAELAKTDPVKASAAWSGIVEKWTIAGQVAALKPLTADQLAVSGMQATGMWRGHIASAEAKLEKAPPEELKTAKADERDRVKVGLVQLELLNQLRGTNAEFVRQYGGLLGEEFQATVNQALFFGNGATIDGWLKPARENLVARLAKIEDTRALADEMSWAVFSRGALESEQQAVGEYLKSRAEDRAAAIGEMVWALLSSSEFRFNH